MAHEQLARFASGQDHRIVIRLDWGENDTRNREKIVKPMPSHGLKGKVGTIE